MGEELKIVSTDNFFKQFCYRNKRRKGMVSGGGKWVQERIVLSTEYLNNSWRYILMPAWKGNHAELLYVTALYIFQSGGY